MKTESKLGLWNEFYKGRTKRKMYSDPITATLASQWLNIKEIKTIEDWGCGFGGFKDYVAPHQTYVGVDGSESAFVDKIEDLEKYTTVVDAIHMRHVLEHNQQWRIIFRNFLKSFEKRAVLTLFTPFTEKETIIKLRENAWGTGRSMVDISLPLDEITNIISEFSNIKYHTRFDLVTETQYKIEHIFYLEKF